MKEKIARKKRNSGITEENLRQRIVKEEAGAFYPQVFVTLAVSFGSFSFGNILSWSGPAMHHMTQLKFSVIREEWDFAWLVTLAPLGAALGIFPCAFITQRIGPRKAMLLQAPVLLVSWFLMAYYDSYKIYCFAHSLSAFCAIWYLYSGEMLLIQTVQRKYMKILFTCFRSAKVLGILSINTMSTLLDKRIWLCAICASVTVICCFILFFVHDSPVFLFRHNELDAEKSLKFYSGKSNVGPDLLIIRQYILFLTISSYSNQMILSSKAVKKTILIFTVLECVRIASGYYPFVIDSGNIFTKSTSIISPYIDNIIFGVVLFISQFLGHIIHLHKPFGVRKPLLVSTMLITLILASLAVIYLTDKKLHTVNCMLPYGSTIGLCLFAVAFEMGLNICPDLILYDYSPCQVYDYLLKIQMLCHWLLVFGTVFMYMYVKNELGLTITFIILAGISVIGYFIVALFVIESKGKSLPAIQMELGVNPSGNRGSRRQRVANPFEQYADVHYLNDIINSHNSTDDVI